MSRLTFLFHHFLLVVISAENGVYINGVLLDVASITQLLADQVLTLTYMVNVVVLLFFAFPCRLE